MKLLIPPIKSQGIKTKLIPCLAEYIPADFKGRWVEPFMGTGVAGFNLAPQGALMCDTNPHLINFYQALAQGAITLHDVRAHLSAEGAALLNHEESHYYRIRERFNKTHHPLDFLFLNRACFNGMIRFNRKGEFNTPFCRKPKRFLQGYITKIANQTGAVIALLRRGDFTFKCQPFEQTIAESGADDMLYCDPPYIDRHADYYNGWDAENEKNLHRHLKQYGGRFILSTWHHNSYRHNGYITSLWSDFNISTREHFYHIGGFEENRNSMTEAIVSNRPLPPPLKPPPRIWQAALLEKS